MHGVTATGVLTNRIRNDQGVVIWLEGETGSGVIGEATAYLVPTVGDGADQELADLAMVLPLEERRTLSYRPLRGVRIVTGIG